MISLYWVPNARRQLLTSLLCRHCSATPLSLAVFASRTPDYTQGRRLVIRETCLYRRGRWRKCQHEPWPNSHELILLAWIPIYMATYLPISNAAFVLQKTLRQQGGMSTYRPAYPHVGDFGYNSSSLQPRYWDRTAADFCCWNVTTIIAFWCLHLYSMTI